jgi:hypothetical protein
MVPNGKGEIIRKIKRDSLNVHEDKDDSTKHIRTIDDINIGDRVRLKAGIPLQYKMTAYVHLSGKFYFIEKTTNFWEFWKMYQYRFSIPK